MPSIGFASRAVIEEARRTVAGNMMMGLHHCFTAGDKPQGGETANRGLLEVRGYPCLVIEAKPGKDHVGFEHAVDVAAVDSPVSSPDQQSLVRRQSREVVLSARFDLSLATTPLEWVRTLILILVTHGGEAVNKAVQEEQAARREVSTAGTVKDFEVFGKLREKQLDSALTLRAQRKLNAEFSSTLIALEKAATELHGCCSSEIDDSKQRWLDKGGQFDPRHMLRYDNEARIDLFVGKNLYVEWFDVVEKPGSYAMTGVNDAEKFVMWGMIQALGATPRKADGTSPADGWKESGRIPANIVQEVCAHGHMAGRQITVHDPDHPERRLYMDSGMLCDRSPLATLNEQGQKAVFGIVDEQVMYVERAVRNALKNDLYDDQKTGSLSALSTDPAVAHWFFTRAASTIRLDGTGRTLRDMMPTKEFGKLRNAYVNRSCTGARQSEVQGAEAV